MVRKKPSGSSSNTKRKRGKPTKDAANVSIYFNTDSQNEDENSDEDTGTKTSKSKGSKRTIASKVKDLKVYGVVKGKTDHKTTGCGQEKLPNEKQTTAGPVDLVKDVPIKQMTVKKGPARKVKQNTSVNNVKIKKGGDEIPAELKTIEENKLVDSKVRKSRKRKVNEADTAAVDTKKTRKSRGKSNLDKNAGCGIVANSNYKEIKTSQLSRRTSSKKGLEMEQSVEDGESEDDFVDVGEPETADVGVESVAADEEDSEDDVFDEVDSCAEDSRDSLVQCELVKVLMHL